MASPGMVQVGGALLDILLVWLAVLSLRLTLALFAGLTVYGATRVLARRLQHWFPGVRHAKGWALLGIVAAIIVLGTALVNYALDARDAMPRLIQQAALVLDQLRAALPAGLAGHVPESVDVAKTAVGQWLRSHAAQIGLLGEHTLRGVGQVIAGIVIGGLAAMELGERDLDVAHSVSLQGRVRASFNDLADSFRNVVFAQARIAAINAILTAVFLLGILPLVGRPLPLAATLVAVTFVTGLIPIVGNLAGNTVIISIALSQSLLDAGLALAWLVFIHKLEYFLNAQIIGNRIRARTWELLIVMVVMETLFGLAGLVSAPVLYAQIKQRLAQRGWLS